MTATNGVRGSVLLLLAVSWLSTPAAAQTVKASVDCAGTRLSGAEREVCASPELTRLASEVDALTARLEGTLAGREREALVDTERPVLVERNDCQNNPTDPEVSPSERVGVHDCIQAVLQRRLTGLTQAASMPARVFDEISRYTFLDVPFVAKWGVFLEGKRVRVFGCLTFDPEMKIGAIGAMIATANGMAVRDVAIGILRESCSATDGQRVTVWLGAVTRENMEWLEKSGGVSTHWRGTLERRNGEVVLAHFGRPE